jgi:hypothetical protein
MPLLGELLTTRWLNPAQSLEGQALQDPGLEASLFALHSAVPTLSTPVVDLAALDRLVTDLAPTRP